ncbi:MAG: TetR/AcrR family transcriptional regulator C-terminal ligand-binding domain-containing protein, partial [Acidimicrobiales bacterium]
MSGQHAPDPGRRSERSHQAILDAAFALIQEGGYGRLTIEAIAARAGVGKQTIYRWWGSRGAVTLEALVQMAGTAIAFPDTGDVGADLCTQMSAVIRLMADPVIGPAYAGLIADSQFDPVMADVLYGRFIGPRISACAKRLEAGQTRGQVDAAIDLRVTAELLFGAIYHRLLLHSGPLTTDYVGTVVDMVMRGLAAPRPGGGGAQHGGREQDPPSTTAAASLGPRSRDAILHAAYELCGEQGFGALTTEAVAARAKVGKQTIYRWWPSKGAVVLDALLGVLQGDVTYPDTGDIAADLRARLHTLVPLYTSSDFGPIYRGLIAESQFDARLAEDLYGRLIGPRMAACRRRLARAQEQGQVANSLDLQCITE